MILTIKNKFLKIFLMLKVFNHFVGGFLKIKQNFDKSDDRRSRLVVEMLTHLKIQKKFGFG